MFTSVRHETELQFYIRWIARVLSAFSVGLIVLFVFAEAVDITNLGWKEGLVVLLFPVGVFAGLILGWEDELRGGVLAVGSIVAFYIIYAFAFGGSIRESWWFLLMASPGFLFLLYGLISVQVGKVKAGNIVRHQ